MMNAKYSAASMSGGRNTSDTQRGSPTNAVTVNSRNLNGDVDIFTAVTYRPLLKISIYANTIPPEVTKGVYFRSRQILILRVEARSPDDDPGQYRITFGGSFQPFSGGIPVAENSESPSDTATASRGTKRLSSVGATLPKPPPEMTETAEAKPSPSPEKTVEKVSESTEGSRTETEKPATTARKNTVSPPRRGSRPSTSRRPPPAKKTDTKATERATSESTKLDPAKTEPEKTEPSKKEKGVIDEKPSSLKEKSAAATPADNAKPQDIVAMPTGPRLIIEEKDGTRIERPMSSVRRVVIEGSTIVVLLKNGKTERIAMADVARMAIEPQQ